MPDPTPIQRAADALTDWAGNLFDEDVYISPAITPDAARVPFASIDRDQLADVLRDGGHRCEDCQAVWLADCADCRAICLALADAVLAWLTRES